MRTRAIENTFYREHILQRTHECIFKDTCYREHVLQRAHESVVADSITKEKRVKYCLLYREHILCAYPKTRE